MSLATLSLAKESSGQRPSGQCSSQQCPSQKLFLATIVPLNNCPFLCKWSFTKRTYLQMTKIKRTEEHGVLQMIIRMIRPPPCYSVPLQMVICKKDCSLDNQNQGDGGEGCVASYHLEDPASSGPLQMVVCKEDCPFYGQNQRDGGAKNVANDHLDDPSFSVLLRSFANSHLQRGWINIFWSYGAEIRTRPAPSMENPQYKISAQTDQRFRS